MLLCLEDADIPQLRKTDTPRTIQQPTDGRRWAVFINTFGESYFALLSFLARRDFLRAAVFLWIVPLAASLSTFL